MGYIATFALMIFLNSTRLIAQTPSDQTDLLLSVEEQAAMINLGIVGTSNVVFNEGRSSGELITCSIVFTTIFQDFAYNEGRLHIANGNFTIFGQGELPLLSMKLGIAPLTKGIANYESPEFAYFESSFGSSAGVKQVSQDTDPGYKVFVYSPDDPLFFDMYESLLDSQKLEISFNRNSGGLDQSMELETDVIDATVNEAAARVIRVKSEDTMTSFRVCSLSLLNKMMGSETP